MTDLHGGTDAIEIGSDIYVRAPGLVGSVDLVQAVVLGTRSGEESATPTLVGALARQELTVRYSVEIAAAAAGTGAPQTNRGADGRPQLTLEVPAVGSDQTQVALLADEAGVVTWHYAQPGTLQNLVRFDVPADAVAHGRRRTWRCNTRPGVGDRQETVVGLGLSDPRSRGGGPGSATGRVVGEPAPTAGAAAIRRSAGPRHRHPDRR